VPEARQGVLGRLPSDRIDALLATIGTRN
jgi:hypothetical protein